MFQENVHVKKSISNPLNVSIKEKRFLSERKFSLGLHNFIFTILELFPA